MRLPCKECGKTFNNLTPFCHHCGSFEDEDGSGVFLMVSITCLIVLIIGGFLVRFFIKNVI